MLKHSFITSDFQLYVSLKMFGVYEKRYCLFDYPKLWHYVYFYFIFKQTSVHLEIIKPHILPLVFLYFRQILWPRKMEMFFIIERFVWNVFWVGIWGFYQIVVFCLLTVRPIIFHHMSGMFLGSDCITGASIVCHVLSSYVGRGFDCVMTDVSYSAYHIFSCQLLDLVFGV